jgi:hypothetical protein
MAARKPAKVPAEKKKKKKEKTTARDGRDERASQEEKTAAERFVRDVLTRAEAARPDEHGELPPGATHEIVEERAGEPPKVKRKRFSIG